MNQYSITSNAWTAITTAGQSGECWLDEDNDYTAKDVRVIQATTMPADADITKAKKVFKPQGNKDTLPFVAETSSHILYAKCLTMGATATISVDIGIGLNVVKLHSSQVELDDAVRAQLQNNNAESVSLKLTETIKTVTLAANTALYDRTITLTAGHGAVVGNIITLREGVRFTQATVRVVNVNTISLNIQLDFAYTTAAMVVLSTPEMNVNASVTPRYFSLTPPNGESWDIIDISISMTDATAMDDGTFGGLVALPVGFLLRTHDGIVKNRLQAQTNGELRLKGCTVEYVSKPPSGSGYALAAILEIEKIFEVAWRINGSTGDTIEAVLMDDYTGLVSFQMCARGHVVT